MLTQILAALLLSVVPTHDGPEPWMVHYRAYDYEYDVFFDQVFTADENVTMQEMVYGPGRNRDVYRSVMPDPRLPNCWLIEDYWAGEPYRE